MRKTALILDADSPFGEAAAEALWNAGWSIRIFEGEVSSLRHAAKDMDVIVTSDTTHGTQQHRHIQMAARTGTPTVILPLQIGSATSVRSQMQVAQSYRAQGIAAVCLSTEDLEDVLFAHVLSNAVAPPAHPVWSNTNTACGCENLRSA